MSGELTAVVGLAVLALVVFATAGGVLNRFGESLKRYGGAVKAPHLAEPLAMLAACCGVTVLAFWVIMRGRFWITEVPAVLAAGWWGYLGRVVAGLNPDPWVVGTALACLVAFTVGSHAALRRACGEFWPWRRTLKLVGFVVLLAAAGILMVGIVHQTGWLLSAPVPLIDDTHRIR
jgi:hypothetical protein